MYAIGRNQHQTDNSWPNVVAFAFKKDNVAKLDGVKPGVRANCEAAPRDGPPVRGEGGVCGRRAEAGGGAGLQ